MKKINLTFVLFFFLSTEFPKRSRPFRLALPTTSDSGSDAPTYALPRELVPVLLQHKVDTHELRRTVDTVQHIVQCNAHDLIWSFYLECKFKPSHSWIRMTKKTALALGFTYQESKRPNMQRRVIAAYFWDLRKNCRIKKIRTITEMRLAAIVPYRFRYPDNYQVFCAKTANQRAQDLNRNGVVTIGELRVWSLDAYHRAKKEL